MQLSFTDYAATSGQGAVWRGDILTNTGDFKQIHLAPGQVLDVWMVPKGGDLDLWLYNGQHNEPYGLPRSYSENEGLAREHLSYRATRDEWVTVQIFPYGAIGKGMSFTAQATIQEKSYPKPLKHVDIISDDHATALEWSILLQEAEIGVTIYPTNEYPNNSTANLIWLHGAANASLLEYLKNINKKPLVVSGGDVALDTLQHLGVLRNSSIQSEEIVDGFCDNTEVLPIQKLYYPIEFDMTGNGLNLYKMGGEWCTGLVLAKSDISDKLYYPVIHEDQVGVLACRIKKDLAFWGMLERNNSTSELDMLLVDVLWWLQR